MPRVPQLAALLGGEARKELLSEKQCRGWGAGREGWKEGPPGGSTLYSPAVIRARSTSPPIELPTMSGRGLCTSYGSTLVSVWGGERGRGASGETDSGFLEGPLPDSPPPWAPHPNPHPPPPLSLPQASSPASKGPSGSETDTWALTKASCPGSRANCESLNKTSAVLTT